MNMNSYSRPSYAPSVAVDQAVAEFFRTVFLWMSVGLAVTGVVAFGVASSPSLLRLIFGTPLFYVALFAPLAIVIGMGAMINRLSAVAATGLFLVYSAVNGLTFASIFFRYTGTSIATVFAISAGMFGSLALFGFVTRRDLTAMGRFFFLGLIGIIIAAVVNFFLASPALSFAISVVGVLVFAGLTAYDTQKLRAYAVANSVDIGSDHARKIAIFGALTLYLDFINLFLFLLRLFGRRR